MARSPWKKKQGNYQIITKEYLHEISWFSGGCWWINCGLKDFYWNLCKIKAVYSVLESTFVKLRLMSRKCFSRFIKAVRAPDLICKRRMWNAQLWPTSVFEAVWAPVSHYSHYLENRTFQGYFLNLCVESAPSISQEVFHRCVLGELKPPLWNARSVLNAVALIALVWQGFTEITWRQNGLCISCEETFFLSESTSLNSKNFSMVCIFEIWFNLILF